MNRLEIATDGRVITNIAALLHYIRVLGMKIASKLLNSLVIVLTKTTYLFSFIQYFLKLSYRLVNKSVELAIRYTKLSIWALLSPFILIFSIISYNSVIFINFWLRLFFNTDLSSFIDFNNYKLIATVLFKWVQFLNVMCLIGIGFGTMIYLIGKLFRNNDESYEYNEFNEFNELINEMDENKGKEINEDGIKIFETPISKGNETILDNYNNSLQLKADEEDEDIIEYSSLRTLDSMNTSTTRSGARVFSQRDILTPISSAGNSGDSGVGENSKE